VPPEIFYVWDFKTPASQCSTLFCTGAQALQASNGLIQHGQPTVFSDGPPNVKHGYELACPSKSLLPNITQFLDRGKHGPCALQQLGLRCGSSTLSTDSTHITVVPNRLKLCSNSVIKSPNIFQKHVNLLKPSGNFTYDQV
jgi:hypothetical protein